MSDEDLWRVLRGITDMPYGAGQIAALEQLLRRVDAADDRHLAFVSRMQATEGYIYGGEPAKSFVTFSWCLSEFDGDPQPYHQRHLHQLLWHFKYMVNGLLKFPEVPLDRTYAVLDDMERRYREGGHSLRTVHKYRFRIADHVGDAEAAAHWYRLWQTTPRDDLSDCAGCDPTSQVEYLADTGRDAEAVELAEPVLAGRLNCNEQPQAILTALLLPYLRTGRGDEARDAHREAYRRLRGNLADLWDIGDHVEFCTVTGNEARAVELVERHLDWLDRPPSPAAAMHFAAAAAAALRQAGGSTVYRRAAEGRPAAEVSAAVLADELAETASGLAARFDARNGTAHQSEWIARRLAVRASGEHLPLSASVRRRPTGRTADRAERVRPGKGERPTIDLPADAGPEDLLDLADQSWGRHDQTTFRAALVAFDERFGSAELPARTSAHRLALRAGERADEEDLESAVELNRAALKLYREVGEDVPAQVVAGRLGVLLARSDEGAEEGLTLAREAADALDRSGDARERAGGHVRVASALLHRERWADALAALDRAPADAAGDRHLLARIATYRAHLLEQLGRVDEARAAVDEARQLGRELGVGEVIVTACLARARLADDSADAVAACDEALEAAPADAELPVRVARARALQSAGRAVDAVDDFVEAVTLCVELDAGGDAFLRWELANAYQMVGRLAEAAEVAEEAVLGLDRMGAQAEADRCRHLLAGIYAGLGEVDPALALLEQLAVNLDGPDNLPYRAQVLEEAGGILFDADRDAVAGERFAAAAEEYRRGELPLDELRARRRGAYAWLWADDRDAALRAVEVVDAVAATLAGEAEPSVTYELAMAAEAGARVLSGAGRLDEALGRLDGVPDRLRSIGAFSEAAMAERLAGELLLRLDRPAEAEVLLRRVLGGLPADAQPVRQTAWLLARALDLLDRPAEAAALRAEHDLDEDD
ncbi:hypothetical protein [Micromonospora sp. NPDC048839]|uniref:hypothetical protein n=1 Tax=Micromonospora sp. NPDC048839 TaxID=3155641 RepID=UPI0033D54174